MTSPARGGVFQAAVDPRVEQFTQSISFDQRLYRQDIASSRAHAAMLAQVGLLTVDEQGAIDEALIDIEQQIHDGSFHFSAALEDIHMHVEQALIARLGDVGRKLHTARSRNDQVAQDLRLWCRDALDELTERLRDLQRAFVDRCGRDADIVLPAYTHLQRAQPVLANHYWLAYCERFERDRERLADCRRRINVSVLGACAVAGTSLPIDRHDVARRCGMELVAANSIDAASDRDFLGEFTADLALIALHLSSWAEEWILWSTSEFGFLKLPDPFCTGSSIMPQKINPDVLELIRGRTGRVLGALQGLMVVMKGLPLAYNRDLQEDKLHVFAAFDTVLESVQLAAAVVAESALCRERINAQLDTGYLDATTLMEYLILKGVPQRLAHHHVGEIVRRAMDGARPLSAVELAELREVSPEIDEEVYKVLDPQRAVRAFCSFGSTNPTEVAEQVTAWRRKLGTDVVPPNN